jgi:predicted phage baseplate assembly protein
MSLPEVTLDDRTFQDLVNEARRRIHQRCPEWTDQNVSDPGITLIEQFAWMTEATIYRLNRIPEKLHVALLQLLGIKLAEPVAAKTDLRFTLSAPPTDPLFIPAGDTEVGTRRTANEEAVVFQTDEDVTIPAARPVAYALKRAGTVKDVSVAGGEARPKGDDQLAFASPPRVGDAIYLGFDTPLQRMVLRVDVDCSLARGSGVRPEDPPLRWEVSHVDPEGGWVEATVLEDLTGGFNYAGTVTLQLPDVHSAVTIADHRAYWVCCRFHSKARSGGEGTYSKPPEIRSITAAPIGALIQASHSVRVDNEELGVSDGTPGQSFDVQHAPLLECTEHEFLEVRDPETGVWEQWQQRESFVDSGFSDWHYVVDLARGRVELGPVVRDDKGEWHQHGEVPPKGSTLRFTRYRHGGGRRGNVAAATLTVLKRAIPGASVTNPGPALGGTDLESIENARARASMEIRTRYRAVTADDIVFLCGEASPRVARAVCVGNEGETVRVHILPNVPDPVGRPLTYAELTPDKALEDEVLEYLDERKLIGTSIHVRPVKLRGVGVVVRLQARLHTDLERIQQGVEYALYTFLNPLVGGSLDGVGTGWDFGRALNEGELYGVLRKIEGIEFVKMLRVYEMDLESGTQESKEAGSVLEIGPHEVIASGSHLARVEHAES